MKKTEHSTFSNIFFFLKILFKISPALVIGECIWYIMLNLPTKLVAVLGVKYVIDVVTNGEDKIKIVYGVIAIAAIIIISTTLNWLYREFYWNMAMEKTSKGLSTKFYNKAKQLDLESYDNPHFYNSFILAMESSAGSFKRILSMVANYVAELTSLITIGAIILTLDPICLLIILVTIIIFTPISKKIGTLQSQRRIDNNRLHRRADYFARVFYLQDYAKEVRMNGIKSLLIERYNDAANDVIDNQRKYVKKIDTTYFFQESGVQIIGFMFILPLYLGYCVLKSHTLSAGDFVATFNGAASIASAFSFLTIHVTRNFSEQSRMIEKYREFLKEQSRIKDGEHVADNSVAEEIELKNVSFTYPGNSEPTLKNISLTLKPKEKIALVGYNGAGKTTLTNLLLRLYDVTNGKILIGGRNIKDETVASHRNRFSAVFQDFQIFSASLGENVALNINPNKDEAETALKHAGFTKEMANGIDTELLREFDDNGAMLSGGEAQKVAVSRAFYKNCPYVIMDEPSANLDPVAEYNLNKAMMEAAENKTVIFISHRLSTTRNADRIYVMENGEIVESGTHNELMHKNGKYAYMFNLQAEKYQKA
ncbi:MAG: ABC transporter ATP-binding protein/permease [Eubacterium sp.]|nr:ABC transporter ATP-binding protein/permease [Eubacterium sp.]